MSDWGGERLRKDKRWVYGVPPAGNANYAWVQHFIHHLAPDGTAGFVLANGSMSSNTSGEGEIRKAIIEADLVDCMVAMPGQLFFSTQIPVCLWFLSRNKSGARIWLNLQERDRRGETLFIDARKMGTLIDRVHRDLNEEDIAKIADTYHAWKDGEGYMMDVAGFCKSATLQEIQAQGYVLTPGRYVGAAELEEDDEPFEQKIARLTKELEEQFIEGGKLEKSYSSKFKANRSQMKATVYGPIKDDWEIETLKDLCVSSGIQTGPFGSQLHQKDYLPIGTPIITVEHLGENRILHQDLPRISDDDAERLSRYKMYEGDIIFSRVGSVDRRALVREKENGWLFSGRCLPLDLINQKLILISYHGFLDLKYSRIIFVALQLVRRCLH